MAEGVAAGSDANPAAGISKPVSALAEWDDTHPIKLFSARELTEAWS